MNKPSLVTRNEGVLVPSVWFLLLFASAIMLMVGCVSVSHRSIMSQDARCELIPFIKDGNTTRDEIKLRIGDPHKVFKQDKIWIYLLFLKKAEYHLVLLFADTDVVQKHSLILVTREEELW